MSNRQRWRFSRRWLILPPVVVGMGILIAMTLSRRQLERMDEAVEPPRVSVIEARFSEILPQVKGFGTVRPSRVWSAIPEVGGPLLETNPRLKSGNRVERGERLLQIDDHDYRLRRDQRNADREAAEAEVARLEASRAADLKSLALEQELLTLIRRDLDRFERLQKQNAASLNDLDNARDAVLRQTKAIQELENRLSLYPSQLQAARAGVALAESRYAEAERDLARTLLVAPFSGVLSGVTLEPGQFVVPGQPLFEIHDIDDVEIEAQFSLAQIGRLFPDAAREGNDGEPPVSPGEIELLRQLQAIVTVRSGEFEYRWEGRPLRVTDAIDPNTRTLGIVIGVDNRPSARIATSKKTGQALAEPDSPDRLRTAPTLTRLRAGSFCEVLLIGSQPTRRIVLPRTAIDGDTLYVVDTDHRIRFRTVDPGWSLGDAIAIDRGLEEGERVTLRPPVPAVEGREVTPELKPFRGPQTTGRAASGGLNP